MEPNEFKDRLTNLLNEYGEEISLADIDVHDREDIIVVEVRDKSQFEIKVRKL